MIAVAQPVTRPRDGQRILRFLTSLALLALAVTLRLPGPADPVTVSPVTAASPATVSVAAPAAPDLSPDTAFTAAAVPDSAAAAAAAPDSTSAAVAPGLAFAAAASEHRQPVLALAVTAPGRAESLPAGETPRSAGPRAPPVG